MMIKIKNSENLNMGKLILTGKWERNMRSDNKQSFFENYNKNIVSN